MKIAVIGSRPPSLPNRYDLQKWEDETRSKVYEWVSCFPDHTIIVSGGARGVDSYARGAAERYGLICIEVRPAWRRRDGTQDKNAGHRRNSVIIDLADEVVAFWDGRSRGTEDSIVKAEYAKKPVQVIKI